MKTLLMIEDDVRLAQMVQQYLQQEGFRVLHAERAHEGLAQLGQPHCSSAAGVDLVILDLMLPDMDGLEVCRTVRAMHSPIQRTPILMLTAKGDPMDRVLGLELGADDYLAKPFEPRELLARIRAVLRRHQMGSSAMDEASAATLHFGALAIDRQARTATIDGKVCEMTSYQFDLLLVLSERAGRVLSREQIMDAVRGKALEAFDRSIDVHIGRIRNAIERDPKNPQRILTVRGVGYVFARQQP